MNSLPQNGAAECLGHVPAFCCVRRPGRYEIRNRGLEAPAQGLSWLLCLAPWAPLGGESVGIDRALADDMFAPALRIDEDLQPRRAATVHALDARLSVWGHAAKEAMERRAALMAKGAAQYVERVQRRAEGLHGASVDAQAALLATEIEPLVQLAVMVLPEAVRSSCRLLWVDPERLEQQLLLALQPAMEAARVEIRRRQALYRRRARLWQRDPGRLAELRDEVEALRLPRASTDLIELIDRGLRARQV